MSWQVNGITVFAVGLLLSYILWHGAKTRILQQHTIDQQTHALEEAVQTKDRFFSIIAHDLRSPLTGFVGLTELLADQASALTTEERTEYMVALNRSAQALHDMLENLLAWSRAQQGLVRFVPVRVDLRNLLSRAVDGLVPIAKRKRIRLEATIDADSVVQTDPDLLAAVLRNLSANAVKFTPSGGSVTLLAQRVEHGVRFECRDTGIGIPPEIREHLFRIDRRAVRSGTEGESSSGLGLLLCQDYVTRLGGELELSSTPGVETRFWFTIPSRAGVL